VNCSVPVNEKKDKLNIQVHFIALEGIYLVLAHRRSKAAEKYKGEFNDL
jgi:hypothetical protein